LTFCAIIVAAGRGERFGRPKQLVEVAGRPLVAWSLALFDGLPEVRQIVVATEPEYVGAFQELARSYAPNSDVRVVAGGATRQGSVRNALAAVAADCEGVLVHDGARPLLLSHDVRAGMAAVGPGRAALLAAPAVDTMKMVPAGSRTVARTLERDELWAAQTPQFATVADLRRAHEAGRDVTATDDAMLLERLGIEVAVIPASAPNFKVTLPADRLLAESILLERAVAAEPR
jgi:2-C-methyl-D-erythritol 4-phosphate cytidylyltransferase